MGPEWARRRRLSESFGRRSVLPAKRVDPPGTSGGIGTSAVRDDTQPLRDETAVEAAARARAPGILLGIGLGGFVDGILLHQILQWHHLLTSQEGYPKTTVAGLEANTLADGLFHAATWVAVVVGLYVLWRRATDWRWAISGRALFGWMLVGWGAFNVVEGIVNHHLLTLHHVREGANVTETAWDLGFLAFGVSLIVGGWLVAGSGVARSDEA